MRNTAARKRLLLGACSLLCALDLAGETLLFLGNRNLPPMIYVENETARGLVVDLVREMEKKLGRAITIQAMNWTEAQKTVAAGNADALLQINETPERKKIYDFSEPLLESRFSVFKNGAARNTDDVPDLRGLRVGVEENGLPFQILKENPLIQLVPVPTILDGFYQLKDNSLDAVVVDEWVGTYILAHNRINDIHISGKPVAKSNSSIAVKKGDGALLDEINSALRKIRQDGSYGKVIEKWRPTQGLFRTREQIDLENYKSGLLALTVFALMSVFWMVLLSRQLFLRKKTERTLEAQNRRFSAIIEGTNAGTWEWDIPANILTISELWARMLGYSLAGLSPLTYETWKNLVHPDDIAQAEAALSLTVDGKTDFYDVETRMRHKDGSWVWVNNRGKVTVRSPDGKAVQVCGTHIDIASRKIAEEKNTALLAEKELILKEVHHRIKNNMNTIYGLIILQASCIKNAAAIEALQDTGKRVKSMAILYERLYNSAGTRDLAMRDYLEPLILEIVANFPNSPLVKTETRIDDTVLDIKRLQPLGIIVNELLTNIMKYAFSGRKEGLITVSSSRRDGLIVLTVEDDGIGMPESVDFDNSTGFGLVLVHGLTRQLDGTIRIERGRGTRLVLEFPE